MGSYHGKNGVVSFNAELVGEIKSWSYNETVELADITAMGNSQKAYSPGIPDGSGQVTAVMSIVTGSAQDSGQADIDIGDQVTLILYPATATAGYTKFQGTVTVTSIDRSADLGSAGEFSFSFQGALTEGTV